MIVDLTEKIRRLPFSWSPAAQATADVIADLDEDEKHEEFDGYWVRPLGDYVELEREHEQNELTTKAVNFEFLCGREYPEGDRIENPDVVLQVEYEPEEGYRSHVFLRREGLPSPDVRRMLLSSSVLTHHAPRRQDRYFLREDIGIVSMETDWYEDEEEFKGAVREGLEMFTLRGWRRFV